MMFRALFKKQLMEINTWLLVEKKTGKKRSKNGVIAFAIGYFLLLCVGFGTLFFGLASSLCEPLVSVGVSWLYFAMMGTMAVAIGAFGSIFSTYSSLYLAKDNDLLLSMPVKPSMILFVRLFGVWMWGTIFEVFAFVPAIIAYVVFAGFDLKVVAYSVIVMFVLSLFVLTLSCVLGWVVAKISPKIKNKSIVTVVLSLAFLCAYFAAYFNVYSILQGIIINALEIGEKIENGFYPLFAMGSACGGNTVSLVAFTAMVTALFAVVCVLMTKTFVGMATANHGAARKKDKGVSSKQSSMERALLRKEFRRYVTSPNYILNCSLTSVIMIIAGVFVLLKNELITNLIASIPGISAYASIIACAAACSTASMNDITAPSVSLEGKNIWLLQSLPVEPFKPLMAKIKLHLLLTELPAMFLALCLSISVKASTVATLLNIVCVFIMVVFSASFGLILNLKMPNLKWTNEVVPIKQSLSTGISVFSGMVVILISAGIYFLLRNIIAPEIYQVIFISVMTAVSILMIRSIKTKGAKIFAEL